MPLPRLLLLALWLHGCGAPSSDDKPGSIESGEDSAGADSNPTDSTACGDGAIDVGEDCDDGASNGATACGCQADCLYTTVAASCDDGDRCTDGDACDGAGACAGAAKTCDDGDACTEDTCDPGTGTCSNTAFSGGPLDLYDIDLLEDPSTLDLEVVETTTTWEDLTEVEVQEVRYTSYQSDGCALSPVRLEAFIARPTGASEDLPGLVVAHGLGGYAEAGNASNPAAELGVVVLAFSGPGQGGSEGTGSTPDHLFDTVDDPRDSWFWEHTVAAMRGITALESLSGVDPSRLGIAGYSGGGVATLMANGVDDRLTVAVPVSASGYLDLAVAATPTPGWEVDLLAAMSTPKTTSDPEWINYQAYLDPKNYLATAHADTLLINGAQDEFFPITSTAATVEALESSGQDVRVLHIKDWDHGWFAYFTGDAAAVMVDDALQYWFDHGFGLDSAASELAPRPVVAAIEPWVCYDASTWLVWNCAVVAASLDGTTSYDVSDVTFHFSADGLAYASWNLSWDEDLGLWWAEVGTLDGTLYDESNLVSFVEFTFETSWTSSFQLTSTASVPDGFSPTILEMAGEMP